MDVSDFEISKYFRGGGGLDSDLIKGFFIKELSNDGYKTITLGDLHRAAVAGKIDDCVIGKV